MQEQIDALKKQVTETTATLVETQQNLHVLNTEKQVLNQMIGDIITANVQLRTSVALHEGNSKLMVDTLSAREKEVEELTAKLAVANAVIAASTNLVPPADTENPAPQV